MKQALWWWFLLLYVLGIGGLTKSVLQFRRERSRIEKQAGSFPPRLALVAWLGAALATLNWLLLLLWPIVVAAVLRDVRGEEEMLRAKFGAAYEAYAARTGRVIPAFRGPGSAAG